MSDENEAAEAADPQPESTPAPESAPEPVPEPAPEPEAPAEARGTKFLVGDVILIPDRDGRGNYHGEVVGAYESRAAAEAEHSDLTRILKVRRTEREPSPDQPYYVCEVTNKSRQRVAAAEQHVSLKRARPAE